MRRRLSLVRLLLLVVVVAGIGAIAWTQGTRAYDRITAPSADTWFAPYVDVTLTPGFHFEDPVASPMTNHVLAFVVADRRDPCLPTWGTYYDLDGAGRQLDLDRRIVRLRERGGDVVVSFGGAINRELAVACTDSRSLLAAYRSVIERYDLRSVDFDIEGPALADLAGHTRRAVAIRALQREAAADGRPLNVWVTVPVAPDGMPVEAVRLIDVMLAEGVDLAGVNVMTMNYGGSRAPGDSMAQATEKALRATFQQLDGAYRRAGKVLTPADVWRRIGATPMIGRNDVEGDTFGIGDARALVDFANEVRLGRVSIWSANRDDRCGVQSDANQVSNTCSGVEQEPLEFQWELGRLNGALPERTPPAVGQDRARAVGGDDPRMSPYPIWRSAKAYVRGEKVVWHGSVYEAKWWTQGDLPDEPVEKLWDTPWRYVGPVLPTDAPSLPRQVPGQQPKWTADQVFLKGDRVRHEGFVYEAKWWTQGTTPDPDPDRPDDVPWRLVGRAAPEASRIVTASYPAWNRARAYLPGARVVHGRYAFEARWWTKGFRPEAAPEKPDAVPWKVLGRVGDASAKTTPRATRRSRPAKKTRPRTTRAPARERARG